MAEVRGVEETARNLRRLSPLMRARITEALDQGAREIRDRAKAIAPVDSGDMRDAIEIRDSLDGFTGTGAIGNFARSIRGEANGLVRYIGVFPSSRRSGGWYAAWLEFGTSKMRAQPFLLPSFFSLRRRVQGRIKRAVTAAIKDVASRRISGG